MNLDHPSAHTSAPAPAPQDQSDPAPGWILAAIAAVTIGVPMLAFWIGRWTA